MTRVPVIQVFVEKDPAGDTTPSSAPEALIDAARGGCSRSLGELAARYRRYLLLVANQSLSPALRAKVGASDLVQETLLNFQEKFGRFEGKNEAELLTWLRRILYFRALQVARKYGDTQARDVHREVSIDESNGSIGRAPLVDAAPTPCTCLLAREHLSDLESAIAALPAGARRVIELRNFERRSFPEIGEMLGCSSDVARKRWVRAVGQLRIQMSHHE